MIQCPDCRQIIPDDSAFCDQCGKQLMWCPECKRPKRGTECPVCGNDLIPGPRYLAGGSSKPVERPQSTETGAPVLAGNGWRLALKEGPFGRRGGIWPELGSCPYVSGNHGLIGRDASGWTLADVGSTNGTWVNGSRLTPNVPVPLKKGDRVKIATLEFTVE